jgi:hypothetical protein
MITSRIAKFLSPASSRLGLAGILAIAVGSSGCAGVSGSVRSATFDVRGSALVSDPEPQMLIEGPVRLLHVDLDRTRDVTLFRVPRRPGSGVDCRQQAVAIAANELARAGTSHLDLDVAADQAVCFAVGPEPRGSRKVLLSWHARGQKSANPTESLQIARLP